MSLSSDFQVLLQHEKALVPAIMLIMARSARKLATFGSGEFFALHSLWQVSKTSKFAIDLKRYVRLGDLRNMDVILAKLSNWNYWPQVLGYLIGAVGASFAQLQSGQPLINVTSKRNPITRLTRSTRVKFKMLSLAGIIGLIPTFMFVKPGGLEAAIAASFFVIPYIHSGNWVGLVQEKSNGV